MDDMRERILAAAREACGESGLSADAKAIAILARVSEPTLYRRFPTRIRLLDTVVEEMLQSAERHLRQVDRRAGAAVMIREINRAGFRHVEWYGQLASEVTAGKLPPELLHHLPRVHRLWAFMGSVIKLGIDQGDFRRDANPRLWVIGWRALVSTDALAAFTIDGGVVSHADMSEIVSSFLLSGLSARLDAS